jgi:hypothetical protein
VQPTQILHVGERERQPLSELQTKIIVREDYLQGPDEDTQAPTLVPLDQDGTGATTERGPERPRRDTQPSVIVQKPDFPDGEESTTGTSVQLRDEDLEPGTDH